MAKKLKLKNGEKFIQILKLDVYYLGLTNKGNFYQLDIIEDGHEPFIGHQEGGVFIDKKLEIK